MALSKIRNDSLADTAVHGRRNLIINGAMQVWQRGTDFNSISNGQYTTDRFFINRSHTVNVDRVDCSLDGFKYAIKITNATSGNPTMYQKIENDGRIYAGQTYTLSFWAKASEAITMRSGRVYNYDDSAYVVDYDTIDITTSWKKFYVTKTVGSGWDEDDVEYGLQIVAGHTGNTFSAGATLEITGVQYELGDKATPFEHRSYGEELLACQRYCHVWKSTQAYDPVCMMTIWSDNQSTYGTYSYPVEMRADPTVTYSGSFGIATNGTTITGGTATTNRIGRYVTNTRYNKSSHGQSSGNSGWLRDNNDSNATITFDAEL